jgi:hypothetical protein
MTNADAKIIEVLDTYTKIFGGEVIAKLKEFESKTGDLLHSLKDLDLVREDPKFHGDVSSLEHSLEVVKVLHELYSFLYQQEQSQVLDINALEQAFQHLPVEFKLDTHLNRKIGNHTRKELLFFACLFHDIGKLKNFVHLAQEVEEQNVKGITRFIHHADFGRLYFEDEHKSIEERITKFEGELAKEEHHLKKKFYETALAYLRLLQQEFSLREGFFHKMELGKAERKYIAFVIQNHMDMLNFYNTFAQAYTASLARKDAEAQKLLDTANKSLLKKTEEYGEFYIDCILLNFCDLLESTVSVKGNLAPLYSFLQNCMLVFVHKSGLTAGGKIVIQEGKLSIQEKQKPKLNVGALFQSIYREEAIKIKQIVLSSNNPPKALGEAGYTSAQIGEIMKILKGEGK